MTINVTIELCYFHYCHGNRAIHSVSTDVRHITLNYQLMFGGILLISLLPHVFAAQLNTLVGYQGPKYLHGVGLAFRSELLQDGLLVIQCSVGKLPRFRDNSF